ncbi:MAG: hypothetical protein FWG20_05195 [Candidatus Cloacimonetes bacterium]|nr:hypothetical protein [Candidatus Cloacimonadota bacterium]
MKEFLPHEMLTHAQIYKYKYLIIPALSIVLCFFLRDAFTGSQFLSVFSLMLYFYFFYAVRFHRNFSPPNASEVYAPINGKITAISSTEKGTIITIQKPVHAAAEVVTCTATDKINELAENDRVSWKINSSHLKIFYEGEVPFQAALIGMVAWSATAEVFIPSQYEVLVISGQNVEAGGTVLASGCSASND